MGEEPGVSLHQQSTLHHANERRSLLHISSSTQNDKKESVSRIANVLEWYSYAAKIETVPCTIERRRRT